MCESLEEGFGAWELFEELWQQLLAVEKKGLNPESSDTKLSIEFFTKQMPSPSVISERLQMRIDVKDNAKATNFRTLGNSLFHPKVKRYIEAMKLYNESIAFSEKGSEARALAYANRSAICFELHRYEECLTNIQLAHESNYPARLADKLKKREKAAQNALENEQTNNQCKIDSGEENLAKISLSYNKNVLVPQAVECLELRTSDEFGRHVVTTKDLKVGDVIFIEKPFCTLLLDVYRCIRCDFCHQDKLFTLIPCEGCTVAMYCSADCMKQASLQYHRYECPIIRDMWRIFNKIPVLALRTVTAGIAAFDHDLYAMQKHLDDIDESKVNAFEMDWTKATPRDIYDTVHTLITNKDKRDARDLALRAFFSVIIQGLLTSRSELGPACAKDKAISSLLTHLLLKHLQTGPMNMHSQYYMEYLPNEKLYDHAVYTSACFPLLSMLNHSCAPNVTRMTLHDGRCAVVVNRPILKGGQVYDNYGMHHCLHPVRERRSKLIAQYRFLCSCEACVNDYPLYHLLPRIDPSTYGLIDTEEIHSILAHHQKQEAIELLPKLLRYLNDIGFQYPSLEVSSCQELIKRCFEIIYEETSVSAQYFKYCNP